MPPTNIATSLHWMEFIPAGLLAFLAAGCQGSQIDTKCPGGSLCTIQLTVIVMPSAATLAAGANTQFTARIDGSANQDVIWEVNGIPGGNTQAGIISATGLYTAPANRWSAVSQKITAVAVADSSKSDSATASVLAAHRIG